MSDAVVERALWALRAYDALALATVSTNGPHVAGVYFAPEAGDGGVRLIIATLRDTRVQRDMRADPRVAFMCSPGNASRWIQGAGIAAMVDAAEEASVLVDRLVAHSPAASTFAKQRGVVAGVISVQRLKIVEAPEAPPLQLSFASDSKKSG